MRDVSPRSSTADQEAETSVSKTNGSSLNPERRSVAGNQALRMQIKAGIDAIKQGEFAEIEDGDLDGYLDGLRAAPTKCTR